MPNQADQAIAYAEQQIGKPYVFGAEGPNSFDCSGLIKAAYAHANPPISLTHFTGTMVAQGKRISKAELAPGDLVFPDPGHVQLYVGGGQVIEAPHTGANVRKVAMWGFWAGVRVTDPGTGSVTATTAGDSGGVGSVVTAFSAVAGFFLDANKRRAIAYIIIGFAFVVFGFFTINPKAAATTASAFGPGVKKLQQKMIPSPKSRAPSSTLSPQPSSKPTAPQPKAPQPTGGGGNG